MAAHQFDVIYREVIEREVRNTYGANTEAEALEQAKQDMKDGNGVTETIVGSSVEQNVMLDEEIDKDLLRVSETHMRLPGN